MVGSIGSTPSVNATPSVAPAAPGATRFTPADSQSGVTLAALSQSIFTSSLSPGPLGLSRPLNPEDSGAILAEAELALDETAGQNRNNRIENTFAAARSALGAFAGQAGAALSAVAQDAADTAKDRKSAGELSQQNEQQQLQSTSANAASAATASAVGGLYAAAPAAGQSVDRSTYVADLTTARSGLSATVNQITGAVATAKQQALTDRTASLTGQIAQVDAQIAGERNSGNPKALAQLQSTRDALAGDLAALPATLDQAYGAILAATAGPLQQGIASLQTAIDAANQSSDASHRYTADDYSAASQTVSAAASGLSAQVQSLTQALTQTAAAAAAVTADLKALANDVAAQQQSVARNAALLIPVFSQIATDTVGNGEAMRDHTKGAALSKGFEELEDATRKFRENDAAQRGADDDRRNRDADAIDAGRVAGLVAGILAGLDDLKAVVRQETAASPDRVPGDAALAVGQRFRLAL